MKRLWPFLLLNVVVSAVTVTIILLIWSAAHSTQPAASNNQLLAASTSAPQATLPALGKDLFKIQNVFGAGDLANEYIHFLYLGNEPLNLQNWQIRDEDHHSYSFPAFVIYKNGAFDLYTKAGNNSTIELYMAFTSALWQSGETITLLDSAGNTRLQFKIP
jgi:hypothetical protein